MRRASGLPPFSALALVSGALAPAYAEALRREIEVGAGAAVGARPRGPPVVSPLGDDRFLLRPGTHEPLCDLLARTPRPPGRGLRVEVDPVVTLST